MDSQYRRLLKYAQYIKEHASTYGYKEVNIQWCVWDQENKSWMLEAEVIKYVVLNKSSFPRTMFILRMAIDGEIYYFLDCEAKERQSSSGVIVKVLDDVGFLEGCERDESSLSWLKNQLKANSGRLKQEIYPKFGVHGFAVGNITVARYKHMNEVSSNWVLSGLNKFKGRLCTSHLK